MTDSTKVKFVNDVEVEQSELRVRKPFTVTQENQRRFIRLEIATPMSLRKIKDIFGNFWPQDQVFAVSGDILNISPGGVLIETEEPLNEADIVAMRFTLQDQKSLEHVLGVVKRVDRDEEIYLTGIEFVNRDHLTDTLTRGELDLLSNRLDDFQHSVQDVLEGYLYRENGQTRA